MSVSYSDIRRFNIPARILNQCCRELLNNLGWKCCEDNNGMMIAKVPILDGSGFDTILVHIHEIGTVMVTSENYFQEFDAGRNENRVEIFLDSLEKMVERETAGDHPEENYPFIGHAGN
jgi:hypothetical protein